MLALGGGLFLTSEVPLYRVEYRHFRPLILQTFQAASYTSHAIKEGYSKEGTAIWSHEFGEDGLFSAPKLTREYSTTHMSGDTTPCRMTRVTLHSHVRFKET